MLANQNLPEQDRIPAKQGIASTPSKLYVIITPGELDGKWSEWLNGMSIQFIPKAGLTILAGLVLDQAALRSLLNKIWDLNLDILAVFCPGQVNASGRVRPENGF